VEVTMERKPVVIESGALLLEGVVYSPEGADTKAVVVVCHPHPLYGGNMQNNVVMTAVRALTGAGFMALTFNFRGVGGSQGEHDNGVGEKDDVRAALARTAELAPGRPAGLAGYSFGAGMAAGVVDASVAALALVSPATERLQTDALAAYAGPALLVAGDSDHVSSVATLREVAARAGGAAEVVEVAGADHFWRGREGQLEALLAGFFARTLVG
jgi:alpha/beta superfamily hydrolase